MDYPRLVYRHNGIDRNNRLDSVREVGVGWLMPALRYRDLGLLISWKSPERVQCLAPTLLLVCPLTD